MTVTEPNSSRTAPLVLAPMPGAAPSDRFEDGRGGGKANGLARLEALGLPVPPWRVVTTDAFDRALTALGDDDPRRALAAWVEAGSDPETLESLARDLERRVSEAPLPDDLRRELEDALGSVFPAGTPVAVRSSAGDEDGARHSFAGVHDTVLGVDGVEGALDALPRVWSSALSPAALGYRLRQGLPVNDPAMAVVVQRLVVPRASGVVFTVDPVTGSEQEVLVSALWGAGEGLVGLGLPADHYRVERSPEDGADPRLVVEVARKDEEIQPDGDGGLSRRPVPPQRAEAPCLTDHEARELAAAALRAEAAWGAPLDLEFARDAEGTVYWLQARPVTTAVHAGPEAGQRIVWDHENWAENFPGITLPMTFSVTRRMERVQYRCFAEMMRVPTEAVAEYQATYDTTLGYVRGRVMTHLVNRYRLLRLIPGIDVKRPLFYKLLRIRPEEVVAGEERPRPSFLRRWFVELPRLLRLFGGLIKDSFRVRRLVDRLLEDGRRFHGRVEALDLSTLGAHELVALYREAEIRLAVKWTPVLLNALFLRLLYLLLKKLTRDWAGDDDGSLLQDLMGGKAGAESVRPLRELLALADTVRSDDELSRWFAEVPPAELARRVPASPDHRAFAERVDRYLDRFHFKGAGEMKLEDPTLRDRPEWLYERLAEYAALDDPTVLDPGGARAREARRAAETRAFGAMGVVKRWAFRRLLRRVRALDLHREEVKFLRLQLMGLFRLLLRELGRRLATAGVLDAPGDVFYLTLEEVLDYVQGAAATTDLRALADLRREEIEGYRRERGPADRFETFGMVYHRNPFTSVEGETPEVPMEDGVLVGTGCSRGQVTGPVRKPASPAEARGLAGAVLVVERLHGGWTPVLPTVAAVLVERGEILSHAATIARELGIPAIVGIPGLTEALEEGETVTLDGAQGVVRRAGGEV